MEQHLQEILAFLREAEGLKNVPRTAWTSQGRRESTAEHSWRLAVFAALALEEFPRLDSAKVLKMALLHDLGELYEGDVSAATHPDAATKYQTEAAAVERAAALLPPSAQTTVTALWREYEAGATPEARLVKALDKAETILQHNQGRNPPGFDYAFNLEYGKEWFSGAPFLRELRAALDADTRERLEQELV